MYKQEGSLQILALYFFRLISMRFEISYANRALLDKTFCFIWRRQYPVKGHNTRELKLQIGYYDNEIMYKQSSPSSIYLEQQVIQWLCGAFFSTKLESYL